MILDTDILVALLKGRSDAAKAITVLEEKNDKISITIVTVYELLKGVYTSAKPEENLVQVQNLILNIQILDLSLHACEEASIVYRDLKKSGSLIGEFDILIAAIARACDETIMTRDKHFTSIQGLKVTEW